MSSTQVGDPRPVRIDDFSRYRYVGALRQTPDGGALVYALSGVDMEHDRYETDLWTLDLTAPGAEPRRLTATGREGHFDVMDDGTVLFASRRGAGKAPERPEGPAAGATVAQVVRAGRERDADELAKDPSLGTDLYRIALDGGEAQLVCHVPLEVSDWAQVGPHTLLLIARELRDSASRYAALTDIPFWNNGDTYVSGTRVRLYLADLEHLDVSDPRRPVALPRLLTGPLEGVTGWGLSADRATAYYFADDYRHASDPKTALRAVDLATCQVRELSCAPRMFYQGLAVLPAGTAAAPAGDPASFSPDQAARCDHNRLLVLATDMDAHGLNEEPFAYVCDARDGSSFTRVVDPGFYADLFNSVGSDCRHGRGRDQVDVGGALYLLRSVGDSSWVTRVDASGRSTDLVAQEGSVETLETADGRTLYYVAMRPNMLPEIYRRVLPLDSDLAACTGRELEEAVAASREERLTSYTEQCLADVDLVDYQSFDFASGGDTLTGYVLPPLGYRPGAGPLDGGRYPGILWVHGGPKCTQGTLLFHELQFLCGLGYFVFFTNPHGAGGRSREYMDIFGHYGEQDFEDLMTFTDQVLSRYPDIDPDRLAQMGGSYGGFMTNWVIGHTDRFRCANSQRSISNWTSKFGTADIGYYFNNDQTKGDPWDHVERMWDQSPLKYADRCTTPTLFMQSENDYRCPLDQGLQMFTALQLHGVPSRMVVFKGENHELSRSGRPLARIRRLAEIADWYARWLKGLPEGEPALTEE